MQHLFYDNHLADNLPVALPLLAISLLLLPPVRKFAYAKTNKEMPFKARAGAIFVLFILFVVFANQSQDRKAPKQKKDDIAYFNANSSKILADVRGAVESKEYQKAISLSSKYLASGNQELSELNGSAKEGLAEEAKKQKMQELENKLASDDRTLKEMEIKLNELNAKLKKYYATANDVKGLKQDVALLMINKAMYSTGKGETEKQLQSKAASLLSKAQLTLREVFASFIEDIFIKTGMDVKVQAVDDGKKTLRITYALMSKPLIYKFQNEIKIDEQAKDAGFSKLVYTNGFESSLGKTWTVDLR